MLTHDATLGKSLQASEPQFPNLKCKAGVTQFFKPAQLEILGVPSTGLYKQG